MATSASTEQRRTQPERTAAMRARLLEATVECLLERGYAGTTTTLVSERAGVSRGAQLHHFPSKQALVLAAVEELSTRRGEDLRRAAARMPDGPDRVRAVVEMLAEHFASPVFAAALELLVAALMGQDLGAQLLESLEPPRAQGQVVAAVGELARHLGAEAG